MSRYALNDSSVKWLKKENFNNEEIAQLQDVLNIVEGRKRSNQPTVKLPAGVGSKVSALVYLLESITDAEGRPMCFEKSAIDIPKEAKEHFEEDLELEELERVTTKLKKTKFGRTHSYPKRRGTMKQDRTTLE